MSRLKEAMGAVAAEINAALDGYIPRSQDSDGRLFDAMRPVMKYGISGGVLSVASYGAALFALSLIEAARVTAIRETAVVFGALLGWLILKEGIGPRRIIASVVLVAGLAMMQLGS